MTLDLKRFDRRIKDALERVAESLTDVSSSASTVMLDQSSVGRLSRMDALQQQAMAKGMRDRLMTRKRALRAAIARIDSGTFGRCCGCNLPIQTARLERDVAIVFCMDCVLERSSNSAM